MLIKIEIGSQGTLELCDFGNLPLLECDFHKSGMKQSRVEISFPPFVYPRVWAWHLPHSGIL